ncbi:hypothetical protein [Brevibacillus sp. MER 51]|uniref:hypothetical protein n=1 Tax=Brevibacillus sp. MER 51 TaxID=2939560 RepID=UPI00204125E1|nr:hypothetical protein [Brevibacillus sp. MER 51]MCM3141280.1 hypothetical protein [Brevibacillus sp. MER 51]
MGDQLKEKCRHKNLRKEYIMGSQTGDFECLDCGRMGYGRDWPEKERAAQELKLWAQHEELSKQAKDLSAKILASNPQENYDEHVRLVKESTETYTSLSGIIAEINELRK